MVSDAFVVMVMVSVTGSGGLGPTMRMRASSRRLLLWGLARAANTSRYEATVMNEEGYLKMRGGGTKASSATVIFAHPPGFVRITLGSGFDLCSGLGLILGSRARVRAYVCEDHIVKVYITKGVLRHPEPLDRTSYGHQGATSLARVSTD